MPDMTYPGPETIHRQVLENGITVLVYENDAAASVVVEGSIRAGAIVDNPAQAGLASITADMLMRGTETRGFDEIYEELESVGANLHLGSGRHVTDFSTRSLTEDLDLVLELLADSIRRPVFPQEQLNQVRGEIMTGLQIRANDTRQMAALRFREVLYKDHPYGQSVDGYPETIEQISREHMISFHNDFYGPKGMIITLVGSVEPEAAVSKVEKVFGDWQTNQITIPGVPDAQRPESIDRIQWDMPQKSQTDIVLGTLGPLRSAPDYLNASMANTILGVFGMYGRLGKKVREEQGLAYYVLSRLHGGLGPAPWYVSTGVAPDKVEQAIESIIFELDRLLNEPISAEELVDCQTYRIGSLPVGLETNDGIASVISDIELFDLGLDYLQRLPDLVNAMTPESVQAAARHYLSIDQIAIAIAGPSDQFEN
jgi:zinc protease